MVIGGYGQVGSIVSKALSSVIVAGRSLQKAEQFIKKEKIKGEARAIDTSKLADRDFAGVDTIVMCVESNNEEVFLQCIKRKIHYIDISPTSTILDRLMVHKQEAEHAGIHVILGVGIAPGISNLLCEKAVEGFTSINTIDSYLMLGTGEDHGANAIQWLFHQLGLKQEGRRAFMNKAKIQIPRQKGRKVQIFTNIHLADAPIMESFHKGATVHSWFSYDVNWITRLVVTMQRWGILSKVLCGSEKHVTRLIKSTTSLMKLAQKMHIGTAEYISHVVVTGQKAGSLYRREVSIHGFENRQLTGAVAAYVARNITSYENGIYYLQEVVSLDQLGELNLHLIDQEMRVSSAR